jgi:predicted secreted hydrolase
VQGKAWFDQEWTSQLLDQNTLGWDWMSLHLDNGSKIMAFQMRLANQNDYITGTFIEADGSSQTLKGSDISLVARSITKVGNKTFPLSWQLRIPHKEIDITVESKKQDQWNPALFPYYEGAVNISGSHSGEGFLELTGY